MRYLLTILSSILLIVACKEEEKSFACSIVNTEVESVGADFVELAATINASDFASIERMGFQLKSDTSEWEIFPTEISREISLRIEGLMPDTHYEYLTFVNAKGKTWSMGEAFTTLSSDEPNPDPEPEPEPEQYNNRNHNNIKHLSRNNSNVGKQNNANSR